MNTSHVNISSTNFSLNNVEPEVDTLLFTACYAVNIVLGLPANVYVVWLIVTGAGGLVASEFLTLNLALTEIIYCLLTVLILLDYYVFNGALYPARVFATAFLCSSRPMFQCSIGLERYLAVVHPVVFLKYKPLRYKMVCSGLVWLWIIGLCAMAMYLSMSAIFFYVNMGQYLAVFVIQMFCCLSVLRALKRPGPGDGNKEREGASNMKRRAFQIILIILLSLVVNFLPIMVTISLQSYLDHFYFALSISFMFLIISGFVQPILYLHRAGKVLCCRGS